MARVDFYVLGQSGEPARQHFACKLAEKAYRLKNTVHIHTGSQADAARLDELLWTFRDGSFVPHQLVSANDNHDAPIRIGYESENIETCDLLINLADELPPASGSFPRVAELVSSDEDSKLRSRKRYASYRDQGHELNTHNV